MLHEFLTANREELVRRCRSKVANRSAPTPTDLELEHGIPLFLDQLIEVLRHELLTAIVTRVVPAEIGATAGRHGNELRRNGVAVDQVVHDYGDLCQSVTELAAETHVSITVDEFRTFNRCLDIAIADAVTGFGQERDRDISAQGTLAMNERLGALASELRSLLDTAILAFEAIKSGTVAATGATGAALDRSLFGLRNAIDRSLADVRLSVGLDVLSRTTSLDELVNDLQVAAALDAKAFGITFKVSVMDKGLEVDVDRQMLGSAISNLLQNGFKFSRRHGKVTLTVYSVGERILIDVADECGGLPKGTVEELFRPFTQQNANRTGLGLGLSISRRAVEANGGTLDVRDIPGYGCVFTIDLPRSAGN